MLRLEDFLNGGIETAMAFKGVPIGISDGLAEHDGFLLGVADALPAPGCEYPAGAVQKVLLPGDCGHFDAPARLAELVPKFLVSGSPGVQLAGGSHAGVDVDENGAVLLDGDGHLDVEIPDAAIGAAGVDSFRKQVGVYSELLEASDFFLLGG